MPILKDINSLLLYFISRFTAGAPLGDALSLKGKKQAVKIALVSSS